MAQYNFLSGSSITNYTEFLFDIFQSDNVYLGFNKGTPETQWGTNTLIAVDYVNTAFLDTVATAVDSTSVNKFFDLNSLKYIAGASSLDSKRKIFLHKYANNDINFTNNIIGNDLNLDNLYLSFMGENFIIIEGLPYNWNSYINYSTSATYYFTNYSNNINSMRIKIAMKKSVDVPYYTTNCKLLMSEGGTGTPYIVKDNIQRVTNVLGENYVTGMRDNTIIQNGDTDEIFAGNSVENKTILKNAVFTLVDYSSPNNVLYDNMTFVDPNEGDTSEIYEDVTGYSVTKKYVTFKYVYTTNEYQYIQFIIGANQTDELAIWSDSLPYDTVHPIADSNPPALDVSYLRHTNISTSIFDVNGLTKIDSNAGEVEFVKELFSTASSAEYSSYGFDIENITMVGENVNHLGYVRTAIPSSTVTDTIELQDFHTFVVGDVIQIPIYPSVYETDKTSAVSGYTVIDIDNTPTAAFITLNQNIILGVGETLDVNYELTSNATNVTATMMLAKTADKNLALKYGFYNILISKTVPLLNVNGAPTENVYRQLMIVYKPKDSSDTICTANIYNGDTTNGNANFNSTTWKYNNGNLIYIANKIPVYRKWANVDEEFKIII